MSELKNNKVFFNDLGNISYEGGLEKQLLVFNKIISTKISNRELATIDQQPTPNYLYFCEHPHVYTLGKSGDRNNLLLNQQELADKEATYFEIGRGGDITYHGPGQLVGYPILDLENFFTDIHKYLRNLEEAIILLLAEYNLHAGRIPGLTGVWLGLAEGEVQRKICAFGVKMSRWVSMHGFSLNVNTNLSYFENIIPCGIKDKAVTSMEKELGHQVNMIEVKNKLLEHLANIFEMKIVAIHH